MNIQQAKQEMENTIRAYLRKDDLGNYCFPAIHQRPLLLMGPPGIGKTAIMAQIAEKMKIGLVSYTMTHHTRQSAIGLPRIVEQSFAGETVSVTHYTMSEIIASVYETMEKRKCSEGILFLDEINCVSDTLAPTMLQFLQNKTFGTHRLPEGWVIVAAGNPPEYNKSVRDFDVVTLDRIRTLEVEPDTAAFLDYGLQRGIHGAVLSWLRLNPGAFYHVSRRENRMFYVTARGWEDLSALLASYEAMRIPVTEEVVSQFLCLPETSRAFFGYYSLYESYRTDYRFLDIFSGTLSGEDYAVRCRMAAGGDLMERFAVTELVLQGIRSACVSFAREEESFGEQRKLIHAFLGQSDSLEQFLNGRREALETKQQFGLQNDKALRQEEWGLVLLEGLLLEWKRQRASQEEIREALRSRLNDLGEAQMQQAGGTRAYIGRAVRFLRDSMGDGPELTALLSGMTAVPEIMRCIARYGCPEYLEVCDRLLVSNEEDALRSSCAEAIKQ